MAHLITGGAGCIGSELAGALLKQGHIVRVLDNLSSGRREHLADFKDHWEFDFIEGDLLYTEDLDRALEGVDTVWHLAAKTDIKFSEKYDFEADFRENLLTTWRLLMAMRKHGVKRLAFASSAAVYGSRSILDETMLPEPVSVYGATKLACEALIRAMAERNGMQAWMFRFCSIVSGKARNSGNMVIPDLIHKLKQDPRHLEILGDGKQTKPSLLVTECVEAMQFIVEHATEQVSVHNIGASDAISVTRQAELIIEAMGLQPEITYTGGAGGWPGDVPSFRMHVDRLAHLGWTAQRTSEQAVKAAIQGLLSSRE